MAVYSDAASDFQCKSRDGENALTMTTGFQKYVKKKWQNLSPRPYPFRSTVVIKCTTRFNIKVSAFFLHSVLMCFL